MRSEAASQALTLALTPRCRKIPPDHRGGYTLGRDELVVEDVDYNQAIEAARRRVPEGWRIIALRVERN